MIPSLRIRLAASLAATALLACGLPALAQTSPAPASAAQVQRSALAKGLYELVYSPSRNAVFVASAGGWGDTADAPKILRLNPATLAIESEIPLQRKAFGLALDDAAGRLYIGNTVDTSLTVVDIASQKEIAVIQLEEKVRDAEGKEKYERDLRQLAVDPVHGRVYIAAHSFETGSVLYVVNTKTLRVEKTISDLGQTKAPGIWLDAAGNRLFLSNLLGEILTIDTRTLEISNRFNSGVEQPLNLALDAKSNRLFVTDQGSESLRNYLKTINRLPDLSPGGNRVAVVDATTGALKASIATDEGPLQLLLDAERRRLYVTNRAAGTITVYDSDTYALLNTVSVPRHPNTLALDAGRNALFVSIKNGEGDPDTALESVARIGF